ncbi:MAG: peptidoglycan-binding domain-containing protein [Raoultibacter sp.]
MSEQSNRALIPFGNEHFAAFCLKMVGQPYWFGTCLYKATSSLLSRKTAQYPSSYTAARKAQYQRDVAANCVVADCIGAAKGYAWTGGGQGVLEAIGTGKSISSKYGSNGCPDKGANSMFIYAKAKGCRWGAISTLPEIVGLALHKSGHVGYYVGGGYAVEWKGFAYGCVKTKVVGRGWTHWYELPFIEYGMVSNTQPDTPDTPTTPAADAPVANVPAADAPAVRNLFYKSPMQTGADIQQLQAELNGLGFDCGTADGIFGKKTRAGVKAFQAAHNLEVDGIVGKNTRAALEKALQSLAEQGGSSSVEAQPEQDEYAQGEAEAGTSHRR